MKSHIEQIKQKLPFLGNINLSDAQVQQMINMDLNSLGPMSREAEHLRSTSGSFADRGLILKELHPKLAIGDSDTPSATVEKLRLTKLLKSTQDDVRRMNQT